MKKDAIILVVLLVASIATMIITSIYSPKSTEQTNDELSWTEFCKARGYDVHDHSDQVVNEYLDTWIGSTEEEKAFNHLPAVEK